jgi:hypothetical protein
MCPQLLKMVQKTPPNVYQAPKKKNSNNYPKYTLKKKKGKKKFSNNSQTYLQENERVKKSFK